MLAPLKIEIQSCRIYYIKYKQELKKKNLKSFLYTNIELQGEEISDLTHIVYFKLEKISSYVAYVFETTTKNIYFLSQIFITQNIQKTTLFITPSFFCIYSKNKLLYFKECILEDENDILNYVNKFLKFEIDEIRYISSQELEEIEKTYLDNKLYKKDSLPIISNVDENKRVRLTSYFIIIVLVSCLVYYFNFLQTSNKQLDTVYENSKSLQAQKIKNIFLDNGVDIKEITYIDNKFKVILISKSKNDILNSLKKLDNYKIENEDYIIKEDVFKITANIYENKDMAK